MTDRDEGGQLMVLTMGLTLVVFAIAGLAIDGTRALIAKRSMQSSADAAVVAAAAEIDRSHYYGSGGSQVRLEPSRAESVATRALAIRGLPVTAELVADQHLVTLVLRSQSPTSFLRLVGIDKIPVAVSSQASAFPQVVPHAP